MHDFLSHVIRSAGDAIGPVLIGLATYLTMGARAWIRNRRRKRNTVVSVSLDREIYDRLIELLIRLGAARVYLCKFFNGQFYDDESSIQKYSRTHEVVARGVSDEAPMYRDILNSWMPEEMRLIKEEGPSFTASDELLDGKFRRMLAQSGTKSVARCAVRRGKAIVAFVGADWNDRTTPPENIQELVSAAGDIEQLLSRQA